MAQPPSGPSINGGVHLPGLRVFTGRASDDPNDVLQILKVLNAAGVPTCIIDVQALRYYGAGRVIWEWDICVPTDLFAEAERIVMEDDRYEPAEPCPPLMESFRHLNSTFKLKDAGFFFILRPSSQCYIDPRPEYCELSRNGVPYPRMPQFARSLLVRQQRSDLCDFIDGMDLDEKWGEENIDFDHLQAEGLEFTRAMNQELAAKGLGSYNAFADYRRLWNHLASREEKDRRIEPMKKGRYKTRWRRIKKPRVSLEGSG